ncbi:hypothetical protein PHMEG_0001874 [Phytophthora megakarya]|uniref:Uncharacterized protein n=1 Tax=Phytophthora megakarya TaxID=4795 RepID=A0A225X003_9STRA|nr:hypothetical protein PHMEG_0001874 [Phytophthora megakarya]
MTTKSKTRRRQQGGATSSVELIGPQPGIPYSTEVHTGKNRMTSPRKSIALHHHPAQIETTNCQTGQWSPESTNSNPEGGLQLSLDTGIIRQGDSGQSPSPLSMSPPSIISARRRPHPPGSAHNGQDVVFGENDEEVKVEYTIQTASPRKNTKGILPTIGSRKMLPSQNLRFPAFTNGGQNDGHENELVGDDPLDQHFHDIPLSPGVKVRVGEESNNGPDLPLFASRMRRSTFVRLETCSIPTKTFDAEAFSRQIQPNHVLGQQLGKGALLTETAWDLPTADKSFIEDEVVDVKSDDMSSAQTTDSCSCDSSSSLVR